MKKKALALALSIVMLVSVCVPGTWATDGTEQQLICQKEEHTHTVECYTTSEEPVCGIEAGAGSHAHSETCYNEQGELTCGLEENPGHVHSDECFQTLTCGLEEHTHVEGCYEEVVPEESSDPETSEPEAPSVPETSEPIGPSVPETSEPADPSEPSETTEETESEEEFDVEAAYNYVMSLTSDEEIDAYLATLTDEQLEELLAYAQEHMPQPEPPKTVPFTDAGPFLPPVQVSSARMRMKMSAAARDTDRVDNEGVETSKKVILNNDGTKTLRLESYVTGSTTTTSVEEMIPVDIVLVLDQSGSMAYNFKGERTNTNSERRQYALKNSVNNFIDSVAEKYSDDADHRISIVTFNSNSATLASWTQVNSAGQGVLKSRINGLPDSPSGATRVDHGMQAAETLMGDGYSYTGTNKKRQKVVIVFTDGVPTSSTDFETSVATSAISSALNLKNGGSTVYSIGIFSGANPGELHGAKWGYALWDDIPCDGNPGSYWGGSWLDGLVNSNDFATVDIAAGNRFLNYLSSNFKNASNIGITKGQYNPGNHFAGTGTGYRIDQVFNRDASNYYLIASNSAALDDIFQSISDEIQTGGASVKLGTETVVKDVISDYFQLPAGTDPSKIVVKTADCNSFNGETPVWTNEQAAGLTATMNDRTIEVTGFDFSENWVGKDTKTNEVHPGKKLIIEIPIEPRDGFLGGNNVPTNGAESGIYGSDGTVVENYEIPHANVPIAQPSLTANNKSIYLGKSTAVSGLYTLADYIGENAWKADFVTITSGAENITEANVSPQDCTEYTIKVTYAPSQKASADSTGTPAEAKTASATVTVHVLKPVVTATINDVQGYYGESYTLGYGVNGTISLTWVDTTSHTNYPDVEGTAPIQEGNLSLAYNFDKFTGNSITLPKDDVKVNVQVMNGDKPLTATIITTCDYGCDQHTGGYYTVHVLVCQLTIQKQGSQDSNQGYIFDVIGPDDQSFTVSVKDNGSVTIVGLPFGTYTVTERANWSWRYKAQTATATIDENSTQQTVTVTNERVNQYLLDGNAYAQNNAANVGTN